MPAVNQHDIYKYRLKELFICIFGCKAGEMRRKFGMENNLHRNTLIADFNHVITDPTPIPVERLAKYAAFLGTDTETLRNRLNMAA